MSTYYLNKATPQNKKVRLKNVITFHEIKSLAQIYIHNFVYFPYL